MLESSNQLNNERKVRNHEEDTYILVNHRSSWRSCPWSRCRGSPACRRRQRIGRGAGARIATDFLLGRAGRSCGRSLRANCRICTVGSVAGFGTNTGFPGYGTVPGFSGVAGYGPVAGFSGFPGHGPVPGISGIAGYGPVPGLTFVSADRTFGGQRQLTDADPADAAGTGF